MSTTFAGITIQVDNFGTYNGEATFVPGDLESEIFEYSIPRAAGVGEKSSGDRRRVHTVKIRWCTTEEATVRSRMLLFQKQKTVGTLTVESATSGSLSADYCRLDRIQWGPRTAGYRPDGQGVTIMEAVLIFKQVRV